MSAYTTTQTTTSGVAKKPCGCGGSSASVSAQGCGCGCGGSCGCESCQDQVYVRPQFFAGQLLTECDLQSLADYVVAKNRLHNRYFFGDGIVCGLTVTCPPCESGHVTVNPGYALDCCGNDIVVSCPKDLDINQMVRQLMLKVRKADCGDPCAETTLSPQTPPGYLAGTTAPPKQKTHRSRYCLYIDYCEQPSNPVAPYATGDTCGQATCEPTRIRENFRFELRCPEEHPCPPGAGGWFRQCLGDPRIAERTVAERALLSPYLHSLKTALAEIREHPTPELGEDFWARISAHTQELAHAVEQLAKHKQKDLDEDKLRPMLHHVQVLAGDLARVWLHPEPRSWMARRAGAVEEAERVLAKACQAVPEETIERVFHVPFARRHVFALLEGARELAHEPAARRSRMEAGEPAFPARQRLPFRLLAAGVVMNGHLLSETLESLAAMRDWLVGRLDRQGGTCCNLLCEVNRVTIEFNRAPMDVNMPSLEGAAGAGDVLLPAVSEVVRNCFCNAVNPPCPSCEDPGVLLACLTVEDCKVTEICNLERKFVLTWPNLRYWYPGICQVGEELERCCCPPCRPDRKDTIESGETAEPRTWEDHLRAALGCGPAYGRMAVSAILESPDRGPLEFLGSFIAGERETLARREHQAAAAAAELHQRLEAALMEVQELKREHGKLLERMAKVEKRKNPEEK